MEELWDVAIVGAGPSGTTAGYHLARKGYKVLMIDKESFPRDKVCGDALIADSLRGLDRMSLLSKVEILGNTVNKVSYFSPSRIRADLTFKVITLKRSILDRLILDHARSVGASFIQARVVDITQNDGLVFIHFDTGKVTLARTCLLATGAHINLGKKLGIIINTKPNGAAVRCYVKSSVGLDHLIFSYDKELSPGYGWIFPMGNDEFNVGCGVFKNDPLEKTFNLKDAFSRFISSFPFAQKLLNNSQGTTPLKGAPLRCGFIGTNAVNIGNVISIGESIGTTFPFSGEGIGKAIESAEIAAGLVSQYLATGQRSFLDQYPEFIANLEPKYAGYRVAEKLLTRLWLNDLVTWRARRSRYLQSTFSGIMEERVNPGELFSIEELLEP